MIPGVTISKTKRILSEFLIILLRLIISCILLFLLHCAHQPNGEFDNIYLFEQIHIIDGVEWQIFADFDGDGNEEYIYNVVNGGVVLHDFDGTNLQPACQLLGTLKAGRYQALDITGDSSPEIFLPVKRKNNAWVEIVQVLPTFGEIDCKYILSTDSISGVDFDGDEEWDGEIDKLQVLDVNDDGQQDVLISAATGFDRQPRGIYAFDGINGKTLWEFSTAGQTYPILCADVTGDGKEEIVFGTWAPDNGNIIGDMDDSHSYLICLTRKGKLLWKLEMGGVFTATRYILTDVDNNGGKDIICTYATGNQQDKSTRHELQLRDGESGRVIKYFQLPTPFYQPYLADFDHDCKNEIIITNQNGCIYVFNMHFEPLRSVRSASAFESYQIHKIVDINQDGSQEIIVTSRNKLLILNSKLEILGKYQSTTMHIGQVHYLKHAHYGELISLTQCNPNGLRNSVLLKIKLSSEIQGIANFMFKKYGISLLLLIFILGITISIFSLKIIPLFIKKIKSFPVQRKNERQDFLLQTLSAFGHGQTATANLDRLCFLFKNPPEDEGSFSEYRNRAEHAITTYNSLTFNQIEEIIKKSKSAKIGMQYINNLQNNFEKLESLLKDYKNKDASPVQTNIYTQKIPGTIESIEQSIKAIKAELTRYYQSDIFTTIEEVLSSFSNDLKAEEIDFKNLTVEGDIAARGFIEKIDLTTIFENIIRNAMESMKQTPIKELLIKIVATEDKIFLEITDTGCGIEQENFDKIFDREFSTKSGGGFGLYHARTTLNKYGGKIKAASSEPGKGTTMRIEIKRV